ncbi:hypothetical protein ACTHP5_20090 [Bacillus subtilis]|uniref:Uncharacterized protein n=2 Tax=Bacillus subtilis TaxID=1423 RepID=B7U596_BACIU|nr:MULTISPECIES: hypothetical protein [Bacillus]ACJ66899.1 conserved hypothetical protein [Bacillus subtilis]APB62305.1 hypothetical protein pBS72_0360 [Bacillus subtilis]MEC2297177.1 hypothetical protein [Bacillus subtilis]MEC3664941.1 hypothetical protein [Bacillus subtilis]NUF07792.1 hypothetical protein [Bacillus rugosus]
MAIVKDTIRVDENTLLKIDQLKRELHLSSRGKVIDYLVSNYNQISVEEKIAKRIYEMFHKDFTRIRLGTNNSDRNSQIIIELLNTLMVKENIPRCLSTDEHKSPAVQDAQGFVKKRIEGYKQRKDSSNRVDMI